MIRTNLLRKSSIVTAIAVLCLFTTPVNADLTDISGLGNYVQGGNLPNSPDYDWWYGCTPTSAGMLMGYYDRNGYDGLYYNNLVPGGVAELTSYENPDAIVNNIIASPGHVADFFRAGISVKGDDGPKPYHSFNCLADFMGTSQDSVDNGNGYTTMYYYADGSKFRDSDARILGVKDRDGMYGIGEYIEYAGYDTATLYTQLTDNMVNSHGFNFAKYIVEIDAGRPVILHVTGHSMFGYGYDIIDGVNTVYLYDTWNPGIHTMEWGGSYSGRSLWGVTALELVGGALVPLPGAVLLGMLGLGFAGIKLRNYSGKAYSSGQSYEVKA